MRAPSRSARSCSSSRWSPPTSASPSTCRSRTASASRPSSQSANSIRTNSPVRIAGVNVGKVKKIERQDGTDAAVVTMEIDKKGLPIHKDATVKIRPRIFLEGNFFVDMQPGTPGAPTLGDGDTLPIAQTATPVQLDQVLTALQQDTRTQLQIAAGQLRQGADSQADARAGRGAGPERARPHRGGGAQPELQVRRPGLQERLDRQPGVARDRAARPLQAHRGPCARPREGLGRNEARSRT